MADLIKRTPEEHLENFIKIHKEFEESWGMTGDQKKEMARTGINPVTGEIYPEILVTQDKPKTLITYKDYERGYILLVSQPTPEELQQARANKPKEEPIYQTYILENAGVLVNSLVQQKWDKFYYLMSKQEQTQVQETWESMTYKEKTALLQVEEKIEIKKQENRQKFYQEYEASKK